MTLIRSIGVGMHADTRDFTADMLAAAAASDALTASLQASQSAAASLDLKGPKGGSSSSGGGGGFDTAEMGAQFDRLGARIQGSLQTAFMPLNSFAATASAQFSKVGGTVIETSRRMASAMKVIGGESLARTFRDAIPDAERFGVVVNNKTFKQMLGMTHQTENAMRSFDSEIKVVGADGGAMGAGLANSFKVMTANLDAANSSLLKMALLMEKVAKGSAAAAGPKLGIFNPTAGMAAATKGGPTGPRQYNRDAQGRFSGAPLAKTATDALKATESVHKLGEELKLTEKGVGSIGESLSRKLKVDKKFGAFLSDKDVVKPMKGMVAAFDTSIGRIGTLRSQVTTLAPAINTATSAAKHFGTTLAVGLGVVGIGFKIVQTAVGFIKGGLGGASALNETLSKTGIVFGSATSAVVSQAEEMAKAFGLPKGAILDAQSSIGLIGKGAGLAQGASAGLANTMAQLAADASSFYNVPLDTALEKIRSGLVGESEPLRAFGVLLSEDAVKAEAARMGIAKLGAELDEKTKVAARSSLIVSGLKDATGDLARTSDSAANVSRRFHGSLANLSTQVGTALLPALTKFLDLTSGVVSTMATGFESIKTATSGFVATIVTGLDFVGLAWRNLGLFGQLAWLKIKQGVYDFISVLEVLPANFMIIGEYIANNWSKLVIDGVKAASTAFFNFSENIGNLFVSIQSVLSGGDWTFVWKPMLEGFQATAEKLPELIKPAFVDMSKEAAGIWDQIKSNEAARTKGALAATKPTLPEFGQNEGAGKTKKGKEEKDVGFLEMGSKEAASAIAQFRNAGGGTEAKTTAKATQATAKHTATMAKALAGLAQRAGTKEAGQLQLYTL